MAPLLLRQRDRHDATRLADSDAEFAFIRLLDGHPAVRWWYKNGQQGAEHLAVPYAVPNHSASEPALFYPDFVVQFTDGTIGIYDPKTPGSDLLVGPKHTALAGYLTERAAAQGRRFTGGVTLFHQGSWRLPPATPPLVDDQSVSLWDVFDPVTYAARA